MAFLKREVPNTQDSSTGTFRSARVLAVGLAVQGKLCRLQLERFRWEYGRTGWEVGPCAPKKEAERLWSGFPSGLFLDGRDWVRVDFQQGWTGWLRAFPGCWGAVSRSRWQLPVPQPKVGWDLLPKALGQDIVVGREDRDVAVW